MAKVEWISMKEVLERSKVPEPTVYRRLKALKERDPELYLDLVNDQVTPHEFKSPAFVDFIKIPTAKVLPKKPKKKRPQVTKKDQKRQPRTITQEAQELTENIMQVDDLFVMESDVLDLYKDIQDEGERIRFEQAVRILDRWTKSTMTLGQACTAEGNISRVTFWRWKDKVKPIETLYKRASTLREEVLKAELIEMHEQTIHETSKGYTVNLKSVDKVVHVDPYGNEIEITTARRETEKHIGRNPNAAIFALTNLARLKYQRYHLPMQADDSRPDPLDREYDNMGSQELEARYEELKKRRESRG